MQMHMRIARPVRNLARTEHMYCAALNLTLLATFHDHQGFDAVMLGSPGMDYHFEFTQSLLGRIRPDVRRPGRLPARFAKFGVDTWTHASHMSAFGTGQRSLRGFCRRMIRGHSS
jgi:hypothetical protein